MEYQKSRKVAKAEWQQRQYDLLFNEADPPAVVYLLEIKTDTTFHKIGYTSSHVEARFRGQDIPSYRTLATIELPLSEARSLECTLHGAFKTKRYLPVKRFGGWSECFLLDDLDILWVQNAFNLLRTR